MLCALLHACSFDRTPITDRAQSLGRVSGLAGSTGPAGAAGLAGAAGSPGSAPTGGTAAAGDDAGAGGVAGSGGAAGAAGAVAPSAGSGGAGGGSGSPAAGAGGVDAGGIDAGGVDAGPPDSGVDTGVDSGPPITTVPEPGELFARCTRDTGCGPGLTCYGTLPGYCAQACETSDECVDHGGADFTCSSSHFACRVDCDPDDGAAACPAALSCEQVDNVFRCRYPLEEGSFDRERFEPCDLAHGDDDCADDRVCYRSSESAFDGPGYCTDACPLFSTGTDACDQNEASAVYECNDGHCRLDCTQGECPTGMSCETIGDVARCHYAP